MSDFLDNYEPERNDVVYGLALPRDQYLNTYVEWWLQQNWRDPLHGEAVYARDPLTKANIGEPKSTHMSRKTTASEPAVVKTETTKINYYNKPISDLVFSKLDDPQFTVQLSQLPRGSEYLASLEKTRSAVRKIGAASYRSLAGGRAGLTQTQFGELTEKELGDLRFFLAIRRACKYGIDYFLLKSPRDFVGSNKAKLNGAPCLHYVLDQITSASIAQSEEFRLSAFNDDRKGKPITTSELRYLFRTWHVYKKLHATRIIFYRNQNIVGPLWESEPAPWIPYARKRLDKLPQPTRLTYQKQIAEFEKLAGSTNLAAQALDVFFTIPSCDPILEQL
ncbi:hypothetical protein P3T23_005758 [Paraburkholderia sp. GAS448]|uniref:hypothetical protein n=1 Tax=Paraburkholderia sp. GAS448 TaxID=3035136 RepID=UPI003D22756F